MIISLAILFAGLLFILLINSLLNRFFARTHYDKTLKNFINNILSIFLWSILFIVILSNLGFNVTGFLAGLGILGFIIGFATKDIFSNVAAGFLIFFTKPFKIGDEVEIVGIKGEVKDIKFSFCTLISEKNVLVIMPNTKIWGSPIKNFSRLVKG